MLFFNSLIKHIAKLNKIYLISVVVITLIFSFTNQNLIKADTLGNVVAAVSLEYDIPENLIRRIIQAESCFNEKAVSYCDARGLMQITRSTWEWITQQYLEVDWDFDQCAFDPEKNIKVGACFLRWISDYLEQKQELLNAPKQDLVLACYNAGPGNVRKYNYSVPPFKETQDYIEKINNMSKSAYLFARR
ncbi:MAG: lytic transglycosylase domain-containing protein [Candidatus Omnitrophica bacterium]|nr:lytic transglycosylase domain-containing protein [Candidatus Omnitrophota bacterium]